MDVLDHPLLGILFLLCGCALLDQKLEEMVHLFRQRNPLGIADYVGARRTESLWFAENSQQYLPCAAFTGEVLFDQGP